MTDITRVLTHKGSTLFYVHNVTEAPACECGDPSVLLIAKSVKDALFSLFVCEKSVGDRWSERCEFRQMPAENDGYTLRRIA